MCQSRFIRVYVAVPLSSSTLRCIFHIKKETTVTSYAFPNYLLALAYLGDALSYNQHNMGICSQGSALLNSRVISNDINIYDKHLSWSYSQRKIVWFNIKRHISANRRKLESFISDKWGGKEFWKSPLGCDNNWSQTFLLYMSRENTSGLTYLIGHVKTTLPGQGKSEYAFEKHRTQYIQGQIRDTLLLGKAYKHQASPKMKLKYQRLCR